MSLYLLCLAQALVVWTVSGPWGVWCRPQPVVDDDDFFPGIKRYNGFDFTIKPIPDMSLSPITEFTQPTVVVTVSPPNPFTLNYNTMTPKETDLHIPHREFELTIKPFTMDMKGLAFDITVTPVPKCLEMDLNMKIKNREPKVADKPMSEKPIAEDNESSFDFIVTESCDEPQTTTQEWTLTTAPLDHKSNMKTEIKEEFEDEETQTECEESVVGSHKTASKTITIINNKVMETSTLSSKSMATVAQTGDIKEFEEEEITTQCESVVGSDKTASKTITINNNHVMKPSILLSKSMTSTKPLIETSSKTLKSMATVAQTGDINEFEEEETQSQSESVVGSDKTASKTITNNNNQVMKTSILPSKPMTSTKPLIETSSKTSKSTATVAQTGDINEFEEEETQSQSGSAVGSDKTASKTTTNNNNQVMHTSSKTSKSMATMAETEDIKEEFEEEETQSHAKSESVVFGQNFIKN
ncbi:unnamed protein product [Medioppia subpectinata]|uniref:Uncharacterized protein n=1 Tax=Medioppia subpectinata TaxID=1979941 RepID=A0A7R9L048_9ACAR|nr:unnamed protein product [Medioppia subpectinata]CAG2111954.1 unnamed protein product [Medioppia subpectinata]